MAGSQPRASHTDLPPLSTATVSSSPQRATYGSVGQSYSAVSALRRAPLPNSQNVDLDNEDDGYFDIEAHASPESTTPSLIRTSYPRLLRNYSIVPILSGAFLVFFMMIPRFWPENGASITSAFVELAVGFGTFVVSYALRDPCFALSTAFGRWNSIYSSASSTALSVILQEILRLFSIFVLGIHLHPFDSHPDKIPYPSTEDPAFLRIWWYAVGWALAVEVYGIAQGYRQLALYKDLLVDDSEDDESEADEDHMTVQSDGRRYVSSVLKATSPQDERQPGTSHGTTLSFGVFQAEPFASSYADHEMAHLLAIKTRAELEQVYGAPPPNIPVFVSCLQRLDSLLLTFGLTLLISSRFLTSLALHRLSPPQIRPSYDLWPAIVYTTPTFATLVVLSTALNLMWSEALPYIGVHTASYVALLLALGLFFAGLASWGALT